MGSIPVRSDGAEGAPHRHRQGGAVRAGADRRGRRRPFARSGPPSCSRRTWRRRRASSCPTTTCAPSPTPSHEVGGLFVLDCIASGAMWVDMEATGVDVLISAPQKGWSGSPCCALVMLSERARRCWRPRPARASRATCASGGRSWQPTTKGGHAYHATMPTDALTHLRDAMKETEAFGFDARARRAAGTGRPRCARCSPATASPSVAAPGFEAPGVVVSYTDDPDVQSGRKFVDAGTADGRRRAAAMRRARGLPHVPRRPLRTRQARATSTARCSASERALDAVAAPALEPR